MTPRPAAVGLAGAAVLSLGLVLTSCASSTDGKPGALGSPSAPSASSSSSSALPSSTPASSVPSSEPAPSSSSAAPPSSAPPSSSPAPSGPPTCTDAQLETLVVRGGATPHQELAAVIFTNTSTKTCALSGYPSAQLLLSGKNLAKAARHNPGTTGTTVRLAPAASAQAKITATTDCNAPLSDHIRVSAPGSPTSIVASLRLRGCILGVDPVEPAT